jgi:hypothetical protein
MGKVPAGTKLLRARKAVFRSVHPAATKFDKPMNKFEKSIPLTEGGAAWLKGWFLGWA